MLETDWRRRLLNSLGAPATRQNLQFLQNWQRQEGGGTANSANFNPLNTTSGPGRAINSVGVKSFANAAQGTAATRATLLNGRYGGIVQALRSGNPYDNAAVAGDLQTWVSGSRAGNPAYASHVLGAALRGQSLSGGVMPPFNPMNDPAFKKLVVNQLLKSSTQFASGNITAGTSGLLGLAQARQNAMDAYNAFGPVTSPKGTLHAPGATGNGTYDTLLNAVHSQVGLPYQFGSEKPGTSFDCSGLVQWAYSRLGVNLPRTTYQQVHAGRAVTSWNNLQPGDLIFSAGSDGTASNPGHVVMYVGGGRVVAAPHTGTVVQYQPVSQFKDSAVAVRRIL